MLQNYQTLFERYLAHSDEKEHVIFGLKQAIASVGREPIDVLDVGCGTGVMSRAIAAQGHHVVGIDRQSMWNGAENSDNPRFYQCDVFEFNPEKKFDVIIVAYVLWDIEFSEWGKFIDKILEFSKEDGKIFLIDSTNETFFDNPFFKINIFGEYKEKGDYPDIYKLLEKKGLNFKKHDFSSHIHAKNPQDMVRALEFFFANAGRLDYFSSSQGELVDSLNIENLKNGEVAISLKHSLAVIQKSG